MRNSTRRVLEAVDWSEEEKSKGRDGRGSWAQVRALWGSSARRKSFHQLYMLKLALQDSAESLWKVTSTSIPCDPGSWNMNTFPHFDTTTLT